MLILSKGFFLTLVFFLNVYSALNTLSEYTYVYFVHLFFKFVESLQDILNSRNDKVVIQKS